MPSVSTEDGAPMANSYQQLTVTNGVAVTLTAPPSANTATIHCESDGDIYYTTDGTVPTTTSGMRLYAGNSLRLDHRASIANFKAIAVSATVKLNVSYFHKN